MEFKDKLEKNEWEKKQPTLQEVVDFIKEVTEGEYLKRSSGWTWIKNTPCKYVELRIDMRDGGFVITDRDSNRISFEALKYQYSKENPERPL